MPLRTSFFAASILIRLVTSLKLKWKEDEDDPFIGVFRRIFEPVFGSK